MALTIDVALLGDPNAPISLGELDESFFDMPFAQRKRARFEAEPEETLPAVLKRAADLMGLVPGPDMPGGFDAYVERVAFYKPADEGGFQPRSVPRLLMSELDLIDNDGRVIFGVSDHRAVRMADLLRAAEAGTLDGDPLRPYLILDSGWGDQPPADWATVYEGLKVAWEVVKAVGAVGGAAAAVATAVRLVADRLERANSALRKHPEWMQKGYRPDQFARLAAIRNWTAEELAPLLGCTAQEAEAILWAIGFARNLETGRWEQTGDAAAKMINDIIDAASCTGPGVPDWERRFRRWLKVYLETGDPPPLERLLGANVTDTFAPGLTPGQRLDSLLAWFRRR